jgi:hypothetical protein
VSDEIEGRISPLSKSARIEASRGSVPAGGAGKAGRSIAGEVVGVHRGTPHHGEKHRLDVTVGGQEHTEIVVRVPRGEYGGLEGKQVVLYIES